MLEVKGKYNTAKVFTDVVDEKSLQQIQILCDQVLIEEVFGITFDWRKKSKNIWDRYNDAFSDKWLWPDYFVELMVKKNLLKKRFETADELILWLRENQKWLISLWKKINYGK